MIPTYLEYKRKVFFTRLMISSAYDFFLGGNGDLSTFRSMKIENVGRKDKSKRVR